MDLLTVATFVVSLFAVTGLTAWTAMTAVSEALRNGRSSSVGARLAGYPEQLVRADAVTAHR